MPELPRMNAAELERLLGDADWLYSCAIRLGYGPHSADDAVQETILLAAREGEPERGRGWLRVALRRRLGMDRRAANRRRAREEIAASVEASDVDPGAALERVELGARMREAIQALPQKDREVLVLRFFADLSPHEIAASLGVSSNAVSSRLSRALAKVRHQLGEGDSDESSPLLSALAWPLGFARAMGRRAPASAAPGATSASLGLTVLTTALMKKSISAAALVLILAGSALLWSRDLNTTTNPSPEPVPTPPASATLVDLEHDLRETPHLSDEPIAPERVAVTASDAAPQPPKTTPTIPVPPATGSLRITITEADSNAAAPGVGVRLVRSHGGPFWSQQLHSSTNEEGLCIFENLAPGKRFARISRVNALGDFMSKSVEIEAGKTTEIELSVDPNQRIEGRVVDASGRPVKGADIWLSAEPGPAIHGIVAARSNSEGDFVIPYADELQFVSASAQGYAPSTSRSRAFGMAPEEELLLTLGSQFGSVSGVVRDGSGAPVVDAWIALGRGPRPLKPADGDMPVEWTVPMRSTRSAADGSFEFHHVPAGPNRLDARTPASSLWSETFSVTDGVETKLAVTLMEGGSLHGRVTLDDGSPVPRARLSVRSDSPSLGRVETEADAQGRYSISHLTPGPNVIDIADDDLENRLIATVEIYEGIDTEQNFTMTPRPPLRGHVTAASGKPLEGWMVLTTPIIDGSANGPSYGMDTLENGAFEFHPEAGESFVLKVYSPGHWGPNPALTIPEVELTGETLNLEIADDRIPSAALTGQLVDDEGAAVKGAKIEVELKGDAEVALSTYSDEEGHFELLYLSEDPFTATITAEAIETLQIEGPEPLGADESRNLGRISLTRR